MKLLILTQAVDVNDQALGFFHAWIKEFSKIAEKVIVICLKEGSHDLTENTEVHSLGKEGGVSRFKYISRFYRYIWKFRNEYDSVFVHMNQEYVLLGGIFWRLLGKRVVLWRNHKKGSWQTRIACHIATTVCYTSPAAYVATQKNAVLMPLGIDTDLFTSPTDESQRDSILLLGRLDRVKNVHVFLDALRMLHAEGIAPEVHIYGDPTYASEYAAQLREQAASLRNVTMHGAVPHTDTAHLYQTHSIYVNLTPSGSFDKTIGEALASGSLCVVANEVVRDIVPSGLFVTPTAQSVAQGLRVALSMQSDQIDAIAKHSISYVEREHSLKLLTDRLRNLL